jgi:hypothetical protein
LALSVDNGDIRPMPPMVPMVPTRSLNGANARSTVLTPIQCLPTMYAMLTQRLQPQLNEISTDIYTT